MWNKIKNWFKTFGKYLVIALLFIPLCVKFILDKRRADREILEHYREREECIDQRSRDIQSTTGDIQAGIEDIRESTGEAKSRIEHAQESMRGANQHADNIQSAVDAIREILGKTEE